LLLPGRARRGAGAAMSIFGLFHPETLMTGVARSAELQVAVSVCNSPFQSAMSLSFQI